MMMENKARVNNLSSSPRMLTVNCLTETRFQINGVYVCVIMWRGIFVHLILIYQNS